MKISGVLAWIFIGLFGPAIALFGIGLIFAFPWRFLGIVAVVIGGPLAWIICTSGAAGRRFGQVAAARQAEKNAADDAEFIRFAMMPGYHPDRTVIAPGPSPILPERGARREPRPANPDAWAKSMGEHLRR